MVTADAVHAFPLARREQIETTARRLYARWSAHQDSAADCEELSRMLLAPVAGELKGRRVVVVPDGALAYIPFDALYAGPGRRLIEDRDVVAVFADPVFTSDDPRVHPGAVTPAPLPRNLELTRSASDVGLSHLDRLVSTRREAAAIGALAPRKGAGRRSISMPAWRP